MSNPVWFFKGKNRDADLEKRLDLSGFENAVKQRYHQDQEQYRAIEQIAGNMPGALRHASPAKASAPILKQNRDLDDSKNKKPKKRVQY